MASEESYVTWIAELFPPQGKWREEDYFALPETNRIVELVDGVLTVAPAPTRTHQKIVARLHHLVEDFARSKALGEVLIAAFDVRLWENTVRQPDVLLIRSENLSRIVEDRYCDGPPDWVAEVISPGTRHTDEVEKLAEYARAGIPEYWLLDPEEKTVRVYVLGQAEAYTLAGTYRLDQVARSETLGGFALPVKELFPTR